MKLTVIQVGLEHGPSASASFPSVGMTGLSQQTQFPEPLYYLGPKEPALGDSLLSFVLSLPIPALVSGPFTASIWSPGLSLKRSPMLS